MMNIHRWRQATLGMGPWRHWLTDHGSLTRRLQAHCRTFRVERLRQSVGQPYLDEVAPLKLARQQHALIREVLLLCGDTPLVFAHTVVPLDGLRGPWQPLGGLGNHSLGATLFANPRIARFPLEYSQLNRRHALFRAAAGFLDQPTDKLWARRSLFALDLEPIQVTEVFLPSVLHLAKSP
ncbi:MAG: chorismate lyase [Parasulfuritortus sp.]|nr:chorismate lyase [Parasulfuritortus sp.]